MRIDLFHENELTSRIIRDFLADLRHETVHHRSADNMLRTLSGGTEPVDLFLLAHFQPHRDFISFLNSLRGEYPRVPVILMTDEWSTLSKEEKERCAVQHHYRSPFELKELESILADYPKALAQSDKRSDGRNKTAWKNNNHRAEKTEGFHRKGAGA